MFTNKWYDTVGSQASEFGEIGLLSRCDIFKHDMSRNYFL